MESAAENGIPFIVLDRPNPLGGVLVDGPVLDMKFTSFIGVAPTAYVHGMTIGELALFFNDKLQVDRACAAVDLTARDVQEELKKKSHPWTLAKSFKGACLLGSFFAIKDLEEVSNLELELKLNGVVKQKGRELALGGGAVVGRGRNDHGISQMSERGHSRALKSTRRSSD